MTSSTNEIVIRVVVEQPSAAPTPPVAEESEFEAVGERTPSQKLRLALKRLYDSNPALGLGGAITFEEFYQGEMDRFISVVERGIK